MTEDEVKEMFIERIKSVHERISLYEGKEYSGRAFILLSGRPVDAGIEMSHIGFGTQYQLSELIAVSLSKDDELANLVLERLKKLNITKLKKETKDGIN